MSEILTVRNPILQEELVECVLCQVKSKVKEYREYQDVIILKMECGHRAKWFTIYANNQVPVWAQVIDIKKLQILNGMHHVCQ